MNYLEFKNKYIGRYCDFDMKLGFECVDLYRQYLKELNIPQSPLIVGAADLWNTYNSTYFTRIPNTPWGLPQQGDIMIWSRAIGNYGHVGIFDSGNLWSFISLDQNFPFKSSVHLQKHSYKAILGWLRPKPVVKIARVGSDLPQGDALKAEVAQYTQNKFSINLIDYNVNLDHLGMITQADAYRIIDEHPEIKETFVQLYYNSNNAPFATSYSYPKAQKYLSTLPDKPPASSLAFEISHLLQLFCNDRLNAKITVEDTMFPYREFTQRKFNLVLPYINQLT